MSNIIDRVADLLYPENGPTTIDIKFFCGGVDNASAEELAEQVLRAETQIRSNTALVVADVDSRLI